MLLPVPGARPAAGILVAGALIQGALVFGDDLIATIGTVFQEGTRIRVNPETGEVETTDEDPLAGTKKETLDRGPLSKQVPVGPQSPIGPGEEPPPRNFRERIKRAIKNIMELLDNDLGL